MAMPLPLRTGSIIHQLLAQLPAGDSIWMIDGGAGGDSLPHMWQALGDRLRIVGFEVDAEECRRLNARAQAQGGRHCFYPLCLGRTDGETRQLTITQHMNSSSLYQPAHARLRRWKQSIDAQIHFCTQEHLAAVRTIEVQTTTLDAAAKRLPVPHIDFIKLDLQGAELDVLQGAEESLAQVLAMEIEVEFSRLYEGQPLFADIDAFVRQRGFSFFNLLFTHGGHFAGRTASPVNVVYGKNGIWMPQAAGQLLSADALYFIDPLDSLWPTGRRLSLAKYLKLIVLAGVNSQLEYAFELLAALRDGTAPVMESGDPAIWRAIMDTAATHYLTPIVG